MQIYLLILLRRNYLDTLMYLGRAYYQTPPKGHSMLSSGFELAWVQFLESESMKKNDVVFRQGDIGHEFFIIISGEVSISLKLAGEEEVCAIQQ